MEARYRTAWWAAVVAGSCFLPLAARATGPEAREQALAQVARDCVRASGLDAARPRGEPVEFDDWSGQTALLVEGVYPQPHMHGARGAVLCLYDRRTGRASAAEWPGGPSRPGRPSGGP